LSETASAPVITPADRLGLTFCLAIITHAIIVLGITFASEDTRQPRYNSMDIILVQQRSKPVEDAKLLAQASLEGGGETEEELSPSTPLPPPFPDNQASASAPPVTTPPPEPATNTTEEETLTAQDEPASAREQIAVDSPAAQVSNSKPAKEPKRHKRKTRPSATALLTNSFEIAALSAEIRQKEEIRAHRPKRKFISASTHEYKYAAYMEAWRAKVERVGNLNYPEQARQRKLSGSLILDVALNPDGNINEITVRRSSGYKVLDDSAIRIVKLAAPFSPFPDSIHKETDILHITRTWQFLNNRGFR